MRLLDKELIKGKGQPITYIARDAVESRLAFVVVALQLVLVVFLFGLLLLRVVGQGTRLEPPGQGLKMLNVILVVYDARVATEITDLLGYEMDDDVGNIRTLVFGVARYEEEITHYVLGHCDATLVRNYLMTIPDNGIMKLHHVSDWPVFPEMWPG
jgi:hypothetical protein